MPRVPFLAFLAALATSSCGPQVTPAAPGTDKEPVVTLNAYDVGGSANPQSSTATQAAVLNVDTGGHLMFTANASNPGGVKQVELVVKQGSTELHRGTITSSPDAAGKVPSTLALQGSNGAGGAGSTPIEVVDIRAPITVSVSASNYNGQTRQFDVSFMPIAADFRRGPSPDPDHGAPPAVVEREETVTLRLDVRENVLAADVPTTTGSGTTLSIWFDGGPLNAITILPADYKPGSPCQGTDLYKGQTGRVSLAFALPGQLRMCTRPGAGPMPESLQVHVRYRYF